MRRVFSSAGKNIRNPVCNCKMGVRTAQAVTTVIRPDINNLLHSGIKFIPGSGRLDPQNTTEYPDLQWFPVEKFYLLYLGVFFCPGLPSFSMCSAESRKDLPSCHKETPPGLSRKAVQPQ